MASEQQVRAVFDDASELTGAQRSAYLERACAGNDALRTRVERLLMAAEKEDDFLASPTTGLPLGALAGTSEQAGALIGRYKLLQELGQGGFGTVWMAEQQQPVVRRVALKIIKLGMDTRQVIARFEAERQALALMDHPHIARVLDAGATEEGRPYFVMELVAGEPITAWCDAHSLSVRQRLDLFVQVCQAVQHAHTKGIIHRDLKPSNVLVSTHDDRPHAKVIDFGIAKATSARLTDKTLFTEHKALIGTPAYMSPEQAEASLDIDTRTDVYSLGVLLYELLSGSTPFDARTLRSASFGEIQRIIREVEPPRPSTRLSQIQAPSEVAARRRTEPASLSRLIRGDLDWIVMKALEKDRRRRYDTAGALALDVERHLAGEPVLAAPPSAAYRARKFVLRNKASVTAASLVSAALVVGMAATGLALIHAERQRVAAERSATRASEEAERAEQEALRALAAEEQAEARASELQQVSDFQARMLEGIDIQSAGTRLMDDLASRLAAALEREALPEQEQEERTERLKTELGLISSTDAAANLIDETILQPALKAIEEEFGAQPRVEAALRLSIADIYSGLGRYDEAMVQASQALETFRAEYGDEHAQTVTALNAMGFLLREKGRIPEAEKHLREALILSERVWGPRSLTRAESLNNVATVLWSQGKPDEAQALLAEALEIYRQARGDDDPTTIGLAINLAGIWYQMDRVTEAEALLREALERSARVLGENHPSTLQVSNNLSVLLQRAGRDQEAEPLARAAHRRSRNTLGEDHPDTIRTATSLARLLSRLGSVSEAEAIQRDAVERARRVLGREHRITVDAVSVLAHLLSVQRRWQEALPYSQEVFQVRQRLLGEDHPLTIQAMANLAVTEKDCSNFAEAERLMRQAIEALRRAHGEYHPDTIQVVHNLGTLLHDAGRYREAEMHLRDGVDRILQVRGPDHPETVRFHRNLAIVLWRQERFEEAERLLRGVVEKRQALLGDTHASTIGARLDLADLLVAAGRVAEAEPVLQEAQQLAERALGAEDPLSLDAEDSAIRLLRDHGQFEEALERCQRLLESRQRILNSNDPDIPETTTLLASLLRRQGQAGAAEPLARSAAAELEGLLGRSHYKSVSARIELARVLTDLGSYSEAQKELSIAQSGVDGAESTRRQHRELAQAWLGLHESWHAREPEAGHDAEAARWKAALENDLPATRPAHN